MRSQATSPSDPRERRLQPQQRGWISGKERAALAQALAPSGISQSALSVAALGLATFSVGISLGVAAHVAGWF